MNTRKKQTAWWTEEIKQNIKDKKMLWKQYLAQKTIDSYDKYKSQRKNVKKLITTAQRKSWEKFGEKMESESKTNQKLFYKILKNCRREKDCDLQGMKGRTGGLITNDKDVMNRWKEYFTELLHSEPNETEKDFNHAEKKPKTKQLQLKN